MGNCFSRQSNDGQFEDAISFVDEDFALKPTFPKTEVRATTPLEILPAELWSAVFERLKSSPGSLTASYNSCARWSSLLENQRTTFMFGEILPLITKSLHLEDILSCRLVSSAWKTAIDNSFQKKLDSIYTTVDFEPDAFIYNEKLENEIKEIEQLFRFDSALEVLDFLAVTANVRPEYNPIFTKTLWFNHETDDGDPNEGYEMWRLVTRSLLPKFGRHIESCHFEMSGDYQRSIAKIILRAALISLPNLRSLTIHYSSRGDFTAHIYGYSRMMKLLGVTKHTPLPKLEHLTFVDSLDITVDSFMEVIPKNLLHLRGNFTTGFQKRGFTCNEENKSSAGFDNLKMVLIPKYITSHQYLSMAPIQQLTLTDYYCLREAMMISAPYWATLKVLEVSINRTSRLEPTDAFNLPFLETLRVSLEKGKNMNNIDFIVPLASLKFLGVFNMSRKWKQGNTDVVQFATHHDHLYDSNIWSLMPNLETVFLKNGPDTMDFYYKYRQYTRSMLV